MIQAHSLICLFLFLLLILPAPLWAEGSVLGTAVDLEADQLSYDDQAGRYLAKGNVILKRGNLQLRSDELWWHQESGEIEATGDVVLEGENERLAGRLAHYNVNDGTGFVEDGQAFLREHNLSITGTRIEKRGASDYRIIDGTFTTCFGEVPAWKFGADQFDVTLGGNAQARNAVFYLKDIPSFYVPYMTYPTSTERRSGLLMPSIGYSDRTGMRYSGSYYQVIDRNQDATLYVDYYSDMGFGKGLEYRYIFGQTNEGKAKGYHINDDLNGDDLFALAWDHEGVLPGGVRLSAETEYVNHRDFFEQLGEEAGQYNKDQSVSVAYLSRAWGLYNLVGQLRYTRNLQKDNSDTLQWLPRISLSSVRQQLGTTPFFFTMNSDYTYFWREEGLKGQRLRVRPGLLASLKLFNAVDVVPEVGWMERHYWSSGEGSGHDHKGIYDFSTRVSSRFYRVYPWRSGSGSRLRHMVEPDITYLYVPDVNQDKLPEFDSSDRIDKVNRVEYGLTQRLTTKVVSDGELPEYHDLLYFRLSQTYDLLLDGDRQGSSSSVRAQLSLDPIKYLQVSTDSRYDFDRGRWDAYTGETLLRDLRGNSLGLEYRKRKADDENEEINYGRLDLDLAWLKPVYLGYQARYDFIESDDLEQVLDVEYRHQCWKVLLTLRKRDFEKSFMLTFTLGGIGSLGTFGSRMGGS